MIIENMVLTDFRVFCGRHVFDLSPRIKYKKKRPIILLGGLNGAGKTTILTAIRLALYGKQSLGYGTNKKEYDAFLVKSIHNSKEKVLQAKSAQIELTFNYAHMGIINSYTVERSWMMKGKNVIERLYVYKDGLQLSELTSEQCQGFLNEIIPIGVSDLFFFDGEKIKDLAIDRDGLALGSSIKKLLGLDVINTLYEDLSIFLRKENKKSSSAEAKKEIEKLEKELNNLEKQASDELDKYDGTLSAICHTDAIIGDLHDKLSSRGGAWAATREDEIEKQVSLNEEKKLVVDNLREVISGSYPLNYATKAAKQVLKQLYKESNIKKTKNTADLVDKHLQALTKKISRLLSKDDFEKVSKTITLEFNKVTNIKKSGAIIHDVSDTALISIDSIINDALRIQNEKVKALSKKLVSINKKIDNAGLNISRAPEQAIIKPIIESINKEQENRANLIVNKNNSLDKHRYYLREAMDVVRKLDVLSEKYENDQEYNQATNYAINVQLLLKDFVKELSSRKVIDLENEFINSFYRLSRKDDISISARIDPETYSVELINGNEQVIDKDDLSAGEKQIYAISILEALARTSGRHLPIIIDTPLARLDSKHRSKLINNYFPNVSHQVIILSTDTEVDESFYDDLSANISHAYKLEYSPVTGATLEKEGYFWKSKQGEVAN